MAQVHKVEHAQKDYPEQGIKRGDSYFWYKQKIMSGGRWSSRLTRSLTQPTASEMTQSEYQRQLIGIRAGVSFHGADSMDELETTREGLVTLLSELRDEQQDKLDNLPDSLKEAPVGQLLQERYDELDGVISELESVDIPDDNDARAEAQVADNASEKDDLTDDEEEEVAGRVAEIAQELEDAFTL